MEITDLRGDDSGPPDYPRGTCGMCGNSELRFVHHMEHNEHEPIDAGCVCAGEMEGSYVRAKAREQKAKNRSRMRANWLNRKWQTSTRGYAYLKVDGHRFEVRRERNGWRAHFGKTWDRMKAGEILHETQDSAKLAVFDAYWHRVRRKLGKSRDGGTLTFREFIETRRPGDDPRGEAIRDTRRVLNAHPGVITIEDVKAHMGAACHEAREEMENLFAAYRAIAAEA